MSLEVLEAMVLEQGRVIIVEVIQANHFMALSKEYLSDVASNEACCSSN
jgi:hypothetical protein